MGFEFALPKVPGFIGAQRAAAKVMWLFLMLCHRLATDRVVRCCEVREALLQRVGQYVFGRILSPDLDRKLDHLPPIFEKSRPGNGGKSRGKDGPPRPQVDNCSLDSEMMRSDGMWGGYSPRGRIWYSPSVKAPSPALFPMDLSGD